MLGWEQTRSLAARPTAVAVSVALLLNMLACGRSEPAVATPTPTPLNPAVVLERSGQVMQNLTSFHFRLHHESGSLELLPGFLIDEAQGDVINPDKISVSFSGSFGGAFAIRASLITLGEESYMTNPLTGEWQATATGVSPLGFFKPAQGIAAMMSRVDQVHQIDVKGQGQSTYRLSGNLEAEALAPLLGATLPDSTVRVDLTIDAVGYYLLRAEIAGRVTPSDDDGPVRVIELSAFDEAITIEAPR